MAITAQVKDGRLFYRGREVDEQSIIKQRRKLGIKKTYSAPN